MTPSPNSFVHPLLTSLLFASTFLLQPPTIPHTRTRHLFIHTMHAAQNTPVFSSIFMRPSDKNEKKNNYDQEFF